MGKYGVGFFTLLNRNEISPAASLHMVLSKKRDTLVRLRGCVGWSAPVLFATPRRQVFSRRGPNKNKLTPKGVVAELSLLLVLTYINFLTISGVNLRLCLRSTSLRAILLSVRIQYS